MLPGASSSMSRGLARGLAYLKLGIQDAARIQLRTVASNAGRSPDVMQALARAAAGYGLYPEGVLWANRALEGTALHDPDTAGLRRLAYPAAHAGRVVPESRRQELDPALVWALMRQESLYDPRAISRAGAMGLMQLMPATLARMTHEMNGPPLPTEALLVPDVNIAYGTRFLAERLAEFENHLFPTLASYNAGEGKAREWLDRSGGKGDEVFLECIGYAETHGYVRRILWLRWMYHALYGATPGTSDR
jgi:soluble lytic murein transglycosylase